MIRPARAGLLLRVSTAVRNEVDLALAGSRPVGAPSTAYATPPVGVGPAPEDRQASGTASRRPRAPLGAGTGRPESADEQVLLALVGCGVLAVGVMAMLVRYQPRHGRSSAVSLRR